MKHTIQLPVATLKTALPGFAKVISTKSYLRALASVRVVRHSDGTATLHGTDLDSFVRYQVADADSGPPAELLVPLAALRDILKPCRDGESIDLTRDEDDRVTIGYPAGTTRLSRTFDVPYADDWPAEPEVQPSVPVDDSFKRALREALDCCGEDVSRPALRGAFLEAGKQAGHVVGTDGRHLYCANSFTLDLPESVILPRQRFLVWPEFVRDGRWHVGLRAGTKEQPTWAVVASDRWRIVTRAIDGQYPNWRTAHPAGTPTATVRFGQKAITMLADLVPRVPVANEHNQTVGLTIHDGSLWLQHRANERDSWTELPVPDAEFTGPDCAVRFNRTYLMKALRWGLSEIQIRDANTPLVFRADGRLLVVVAMMEATPESPETPTQPSQPETSVAPPSGSAVNPSTEPETKPMANPTAKPTTPVSTPTTQAEASSPLRTLVDQLDKIRGSIRDLQSLVNDTAGLVKSAEKQQRTAEQEVEAVRRTLRGLQKVQL